MVTIELLKTLHELQRTEKLQVMQFLVSELAQEEPDLLKAGMAYPIWSPYNTDEAAATMLEVLKADDHA